jgi:anti-sigma regulatory factor (Ser/Thr protein kinase)
MFDHEAICHSGKEEFVSRTVPLVVEGVESEEAVCVAVPEPRLSLLRDALGDLGTRVTFVDMAKVARNPARIIPFWQSFVSLHEDGAAAVLGIGQPLWESRSAEELVECERHEALLNLAFAGSSDVRILCPYDTKALDDAMLEEAQRSHPFMVDGNGRKASEDFRNLEEVMKPFDAPLPPPPEGARRFDFGRKDLQAIREIARSTALGAHLDRSSAEDLVLAANEVATNSIKHGGGGGTLRAWSSHNDVVCEVRDSGHISDPLAGRLMPESNSSSGRGLWMANSLCDLVQIRALPEGNVVRLHRYLSSY